MVTRLARSSFSWEELFEEERFDLSSLDLSFETAFNSRERRFLTNKRLELEQTRESLLLCVFNRIWTCRYCAIVSRIRSHCERIKNQTKRKIQNCVTLITHLLNLKLSLNFTQHAKLDLQIKGLLDVWLSIEIQMVTTSTKIANFQSVQDSYLLTLTSEGSVILNIQLTRAEVVL